MEKIESINESNDVNEVLGLIPVWITKWGTLLFFVIIGMLIISGWFVKYPDVIICKVNLTTKTPPVNLKSHIDGRIVKILINNKSKVQVGDILAVLENPANYKNVLDLKSTLLFFNRNIKEIDRVKDISIKKEYELGELQPAYENFIKAFKDYKNFTSFDYFNRAKFVLNKTEKKYTELLNALEFKKSLMHEELGMKELQIRRDSLLLSKSYISEVNYENSKSVYFENKYTAVDVQTSIVNAEIQIAQIESRLNDLNYDYNNKISSYKLNMEEAFKNLISRINIWEQSYIIKAPINGIVSFTKYWSDNQNVNAGDIVMTIIPDKTPGILGIVKLPIYGSGKVKIGQKVNIKFDNYPFMEYGSVNGIITEISLMPSQDNLYVEILLPNGLITNYKHILEFKQEMQGDAEILTDNKTLIERLFYPIKAIFKEHFS